jgi:lysine-specific demethylase/histidyl-hydroxylase NO66
MSAAEQGKRMGKKKRKSKGGIVPGQTVSKPAPVQQLKRVAEHAQQAQHKKSKPSSHREPSPEHNDDMDNDDGSDQHDDMSDDSENMVDEYDQEDDSEEEQFVDEDSGKKKQKAGPLGGKRANEFKFELEILTPRKASELPSARPSGDDDDERGKSMLEWLLAPMPVEQFFEEFWERKPLLIKRHKLAPNYLKGLFHRTDLQAAISAGADTDASDASPDRKGLRFSYDLDATSYVNGKRQTHNPDGMVTLKEFNKLYDQKCSLRVLRPQRFHDELWRVLSALEESFECVVGANTYLTPANSQGFAPHYDDVEVFVLQTEGAKRWRLYAPPLDSDVLAGFSSNNYEQSAIGKPFADVVMETGDLLYFPRGVVHQALCNADQHSLHVTISTGQHNSMSEYLQELLRIGVQVAATQHMPFRRSVPVRFGSFMGFQHTEKDEDDVRRDEFKDRALELVGAVIDALPFDVAADQRVRSFMRDRLPPVLSDQVCQSQHIFFVVVDIKTFLHLLVRAGT